RVRRVGAGVGLGRRTRRMPGRRSPVGNRRFRVRVALTIAASVGIRLVPVRLPAVPGRCPSRRRLRTGAVEDGRDRVLRPAAILSAIPEAKRTSAMAATRAITPAYSTNEAPGSPLWGLRDTVDATACPVGPAGLRATVTHHTDQP